MSYQCACESCGIPIEVEYEYLVSTDWRDRLCSACWRAIMKEEM